MQNAHLMCKSLTIVIEYVCGLRAILHPNGDDLVAVNNEAKVMEASMTDPAKKRQKCGACIVLETESGQRSLACHRAEGHDGDHECYDSETRMLIPFQSKDKVDDQPR